MANLKAENTDKIAIVTGGSRGLGRNTAINLAQRGIDVIFTYRTNRKEADSLIREIEGRRKKGSRLSPRHRRRSCI